MADRDHDLDELYRVPPAEFVRARNALAARLARAGSAGRAAAVKRLGRPTPVVWALNQVAREHPRDLAGFLETAEHARRAHLGGADVARALEEQRTAHRTLVQQATGVLGRAGHRVTAPLTRRISETLLGAVADHDARAELRAGRLTREVPAPGFEVFGDATPRSSRLARPPVAKARGADRGTARPRPRATAGERRAGLRLLEGGRGKRSSSDRASREELRRLERGREQTLRAVQREAKEWTVKTRQLERTAGQRRSAADRASAAAARLREGLARAERKAVDATSAAEDSARAAREARERAEQAAARLAATRKGDTRA